MFEYETVSIYILNILLTCMAPLTQTATINQLVGVYDLQITFPETKIAPANGWLEY